MVKGVTEDAKGEDENGKEVTPMAWAVENAGNSFVVVLCNRNAKFKNRSSCSGGGLPLRATIFHAVGLKVMDARQTRRDRASKDVFSTRSETTLLSLSAKSTPCMSGIVSG